jgi:hypothetical protein
MARVPPPTGAVPITVDRRMAVPVVVDFYIARGKKPLRVQYSDIAVTDQRVKGRRRISHGEVAFVRSSPLFLGSTPYRFSSAYDLYIHDTTSGAYTPYHARTIQPYMHGISTIYPSLLLKQIPFFTKTEYEK